MPKWMEQFGVNDVGTVKLDAAVHIERPGATQPVRINGIEFDALIDESRQFEAEVPQYSVETGFSVSDSIILKPETLSMTLYVTNTPVTWYSIHGGTSTRLNEVCKQLEELYFSRVLCTIETSTATYSDMAITSIELKKSTDVGYAREIPISFTKVNVTTATTTTIPEEYARAGQTKKTTGGGGGGGSGSSGEGEGEAIPSAGDIITSEVNSASSATGDLSRGSILWNLLYGSKGGEAAAE